ncbi:MAG: helix-turn-helix domain-containing protein [Patescibacteria group bacterium]
MSSWQKKSISRNQTLAEKLKLARLDKNVSLADLSKQLCVPTKYLEYLEAGQWSSLPGDVYVRAWLRQYAKLFSLALDSLLADYQIEKNISRKIDTVEFAGKIKQPTTPPWWRPRLGRWLAIGLVVLALLAYLSWEVFNIIAPPSLAIAQPPNNFKTTATTVEIIGRTKAEATLIINNELVLLDEQGNFKKTVNLVVGLNNLQISAKKKHSQTRHLELVILREALE